MFSFDCVFELLKDRTTAPEVDILVYRARSGSFLVKHKKAKVAEELCTLPYIPYTSIYVQMEEPIGPEQPIFHWLLAEAIVL